MAKFNLAYSEYKHSLTFRVRRYVVIATKPVHRLQIRLRDSAQLESTSYHSPNLHPGPCSSVEMRRGIDRQTHRRPWPIYISPRLRLTRNVITVNNAVLYVMEIIPLFDNPSLSQYKIIMLQHWLKSIPGVYTLVYCITEFVMQIVSLPNWDFFQNVLPCITEMLPKLPRKCCNHWIHKSHRCLYRQSTPSRHLLPAD